MKLTPRFLSLGLSLAIMPFTVAAILAAEKPIVPQMNFAEPAISPDGAEIAFVHAGDIWVVPSSGGTAHLLISHPSVESRPLYSPDGKQLAFVSTRTGNGDIYVLTFSTGELRRLTYDDGIEQLDSWSHDGKWIYFSSAAEDLGASNADIYRVHATGGTPMPVSAERYTNEFNAAPSPDGKTLAMSANANGRDWWRNGHSNWNETHIWLRKEKRDQTGNYEELTPPGVREMWPMLCDRGKTLYCVSDENGKPQNIVAYDVNAKGTKQSKPVTQFKDGRLLWPSISASGKTIVFEREFGIWKFNPASGKEPEPVKITLRGAPAVETISEKNYVGGFRDLAVSPDGRKLAFVVHGDVFAATKDGGRAVRVTDTAAAEGQIAWAPDSKRIVFISGRPGGQNLVMYDFTTQQQASLTIEQAYDSSPRFSPDGRHLLFRRNGTELRLLNFATKKDRVLVSGLSATLPPFDDGIGPFAFSPKGQWLAYIDSGKRGFDNVYVVSTIADKPKPIQVTFFANTGSNAVSWTGDGRSLLFGTGMRTEDYQLARVDLMNRSPNFSEDQFRGLFEEEQRTTRPGGPRNTRPQPIPIERTTPSEKTQPEKTTPSTQPTQPAQPPDLVEPSTRPATKSTTIEQVVAETKAATQATTKPADLEALKELFPSLASEKFNFDNLRAKTSILPVGVDVDQQVVTPDGKWCIFIGSTGGKANIYAYPLDPAVAGAEGAVARQLTNSTAGKGGLVPAPDSKEIYFIENGGVLAINIETRVVREVKIAAPMEVDFNQEKMEVFRQAWTYMKLNFYDSKMHGNDWDAVRARFEPHAAGARTPEELRRVLSLMIGELNASHLGVSSGNRISASVGRLGVRFDRASYEADGVFKIAEVFTNGPAAQAGLKVGDVIQSIDGEPADAEANLHKMLDHKIGRRVALKVVSDAKADSAREVPIRPVDMSTEKTLLYRDWVESNRAYVAKASSGRLGYVHIADMSKNALIRLNNDLDAEAATRDGVVVDIRANTGGFVSPYVLDVLSRKGYLTITRRGGTESPGRMYVGQRALDLPTILVTNRQAISDAENFTEGYRSLKLGKVVGEPTAGGVIFTSDVTLIDGTSFRIPFSKVLGHDGKSLEGDGRPVDVKVRRPLGESRQAKDSQLDAAVKELIKQIDKPAAVAKAKPAKKPAEPSTPPQPASAIPGSPTTKPAAGVGEQK